MASFRDIGPLYCETPLDLGLAADVAARFPLEPVNVLTSAFPAFVGAALLWYLARRGLLFSDLLPLALATLVVGVGSIMWHGVRTETALFLDWVPGFVSFIIFMFLWPARLGGRWWGYGTLAAIFGGTALLARFVPLLGGQNGPPIALFFVVALVASGLLYVTWRRYSSVVWWGVVMLAAAIAAATARTVDLATCGLLPGFGTHAFWHIGLGLAAGCGVILLMRIDDQERGPR